MIVRGWRSWGADAGLCRCPWLDRYRGPWSRPTPLYARLWACRG